MVVVNGCLVIIISLLGLAGGWLEMMVLDVGPKLLLGISIDGEASIDGKD